MVSVALLSVGIVAILGAYGALTSNERKSMETERMQRLAFDKYDELVATEALQTQALNGDFADRGEDNYLWEAAVEPTGIENLSSLKITVETRTGGEAGPKQIVTGVVYLPPVTTAPVGGTP